MLDIEKESRSIASKILATRTEEEAKRLEDLYENNKEDMNLFMEVIKEITKDAISSGLSDAYKYGTDKEYEEESSGIDKLNKIMDEYHIRSLQAIEEPAFARGSDRCFNVHLVLAKNK